MQPLPHYYNVTVKAAETGQVEITSNGLTPIVSGPPAEFGGPGDLWSPETLAVAAVADCFTLTFRAIANAARLEWVNVDCHAKGTVDRIDGMTRFTDIQLYVQLVLPATVDGEKAQRLLEKAERACLVGNSFVCQPTLKAEITYEAPALAPTA